MSDMSDNQAGGVASPISSLIGSRTLQRQTKDVLDHIEQVGEPVVILRYGRPAAALVPIDEEEAKKLLLASSVRERSGETPREHPTGTPFVVAEREIGGEDASSSGEERLADASDLLEAAAEHLSVGIGRIRELAETAGSGELAAADTPMLVIQERNTRKLAELLELHAETLDLITGEAEREAT